ncbi:MAG: mannose-1-phosphate guanylyltransferase [Chloroflexota bacterium]|nr:MAG: mannose-1-phosphate guanylyltransferase [Chloroflexota bacterium]
MKIVIFAGGTGRRLWPLSRQSSPKQFEPIMGEKSTVRLSVERVLNTYGADNIYISTNQRYLDILRNQLPELSEENFIGEPERRDLAAAVGLAMCHVAHHHGPNETVAIIWGDNLMTDEVAFLRLMASAEKIITGVKAKIVFVGETARFANSNLGWIGLGERLGDSAGEAFFSFKSWLYRPPLEQCRQMFASGDFVWNTGYFVTTPGFIGEMYQRHQPKMWASLSAIAATIGGDSYRATLHKIYPQLAVASFDDAIVQKIEAKMAAVLHGSTGWSDPGTLYALKEAINADTTANVERGLVKPVASRDCLLYNYEEGKLLAVAGLEGMIVVNTADALLVVHKDDVRLVKELVNGLVGTDLENYS